MKRTVALLTSLALMIPGAAVASANSTTANYSHHGAVKHVTAKRTPTTTTTCTSSSTGSASGSGSNNCVSATETTATGSLPFTGLDLGALAAGGALLLGAGVMLRRVSTSDQR